ncbi:hypothetical protein [Thiolapillus sp.]|uniref:hypothetical protein n=1 Tax=Thiolapillus sp. TaxID=2017437 RepID=UPI003AF77C4C
MRDKDLYAQILGIKSRWQVSGVELALSEGEVTVHVEQEEGVQHCCPTCGEVSPAYDWTPRSEAYFVFPLAQGTPGKQCGLAATGVYQPSLRSP